MVQESSLLEDNYILLVQTQNKNLERLLAGFTDDNTRLEAVKSFRGLSEQKLKGKIITFIIGSDVQDPIQSAQRLHAFKKNAQIILLAKSENIDPMKEAIRFSPFIGTEVFCLDESETDQLESKLNDLVRSSRQAETYRSIIAETNSRLSVQEPSRQETLNTSFINKLLAIAPIGIAIVSRKGKVLGWNKEAASIFNISEAQIVGTALTRLFASPEKSELDHYLRESFDKQKSDTIEPLTLERQLENSSKQVLSFTAASFTYSDRTEQALILAIKDITQNVKLLDRLKKEVKARDNFLMMASHELRTPLTTLRINLELLKTAVKKEFPDASRFRKLNTTSLNQAKQMNDLIEDLFDIAKIHSGKLDFKFEQFNLSRLITDHVTETEERFREVNSELELDIEPHVIGVWDQERIKQAFANLLTNALKYAPGTPIKITLESTENKARLSVRDRGPGISEDKQEKVFERFERVINSQTVSGLGLGLFITKKIVESHNGKVQVQSTPGEGSTFIIELPLDLNLQQQPEGLGIHW